MFGMSSMTVKKYGGIWALVLACGLVACAANNAGDRVWRFDCGTPKSPVMQEYRCLSASESYSAARGYGWQGGGPRHLEFKRPVQNKKLRGSFGQLLLEEAYDNHRNPLNRDGVVGHQDMGFRLDLPNSTYRVAVTMGNLFQAIGSIDLSMNGRLIAEQLAVWAPGGYRMLDITPAGWWTTFRATVEVTDGALRIDWKKNQQQYDDQMAEQTTWETPYAKWYHTTPIIKKPPYHYIGYPFVGHSVMAIEVTPYRPGPVYAVDGKLRLNAKIASPGLRTSIEQYNAGRIEAAVAALQEVQEPDAQLARAVVALWLSGRLETEIEQELVPQALPVLRAYVKAYPDAYGLAEVLSDAEIFQRAMHTHVNRAGAESESNHFLENDRAIGWWWMIQPDSPLRDKARRRMERRRRVGRPLRLLRLRRSRYIRPLHPGHGKTHQRRVESLGSRSGDRLQPAHGGRRTHGRAHRQHPGNDDATGLRQSNLDRTLHEDQQADP